MFSFNAGDGRCPTCGGSGFEHVEMQFLSDVYLRCPDCDGRRYRAEILDVKIDRRLPGDVLRDLSVADVLELTVSEAVQLFRDDREVLRVLQPIVDVGLEYVKLGQPVPTLSGGEAQRLKLAGFLAETAQERHRVAARRGASKGTLFLFDEPTTGLHFDDIAKLMRAFRKLLDAGHSLIVIEHNLDVIRAADWIVDLGPEGGEAGGEVVCFGTPDDVKRARRRSHTGKALRDYDTRWAATATRSRKALPLQTLRAGGARQRGAADEVDPHRQRARAQPEVARRRHPARQVQRRHRRRRARARARSPSTSCSTRASGATSNRSTPTRAASCSRRAGPRSMRSTASRRRWRSSSACRAAGARARWRRPPRSGTSCACSTSSSACSTASRTARRCGRRAPRASPRSCCATTSGEHVGLLAPLVVNRKGVYTDLAKWAKARGHTHLRVDGEFLHGRPVAAARPLQGTHAGAAGGRPRRQRRPRGRAARRCWRKALELGKGVMHLLRAAGRPGRGDGSRRRRRPASARVKVFSTKRACPTCGTSYPELDPRMFSYNSKHGWCTHLRRHRPGADARAAQGLRRFGRATTTTRAASRASRPRRPRSRAWSTRRAPTAHGTRLNPVSRARHLRRPARSARSRSWSVADARRWVELR